MSRSLLVLLIIVSHAFSEDCVRYEFGEDYNDLFTDQMDVCGSVPTLPWILKYYEDTDIIDHHELSTTFISPQETLSCISSFVFPMESRGIVEVNIFMEAMANTDQISVLANQVVPGGNDAVVGSAGNSPLAVGFEPGWHTLRFSVGATGTYDGYVSILYLRI